MKTFYNHNGKLSEVHDLALSVSNHSYRYGDGLFETMKMVNGTIHLNRYHFERLFYSMQVLGYKSPGFFSEKNLADQILQLAVKNNCAALARIRLTVSRGEGGLNDCDDKLQYTIECVPADEIINRLNENGFVIDVFPDAVKSCDRFSNLKTTSYMHYVMTARFAKENKLNDALLMNQFGRVCETSVANIFWIKDKMIYTPPLSDGCVAGTMRKYLLAKVPETGFAINENSLTADELENADEVFLTNAVFGMRWVKHFRNKTYEHSIISNLYHSIIVPLYK